MTFEIQEPGMIWIYYFGYNASVIHLHFKAFLILLPTILIDFRETDSSLYGLNTV